MAYRHLDTDRQEIRLVTLEPGEGSADIQCRLSVVSLFDEIAYEALSYVWGDDTITTMIYLDESPFNATVNLAVALQHLRKADQPRVIWIDALSINQKNITERNSQVNIMGNIYRNAVEVIAWLGLAGDDDYPAFDLFLTISGESQRTINGKHWGPADHPHSTSLSLKTKDLKAIRSLVARPWWRRMWTVQELLLAKKVTFHCGTRQLSVEAMFATSDSYFAHVQNCCEKYFRSAFDESLMVGFNESMSTIDRLGVFRKSNISLQNALMFFRHRQCQDPRDMIYGLVGLASDVSKEEILPDYESPISKVYTDTTILLIRKSQSLRTFSQLFHHPQSQSSLSASKSALELPSWVPDWSTKWSDEYISAMMIRLGFQIQHLRAGGNARDSFFNRSSNGAAICRGLIVGRVDALSEARPADSDKFDVQTLRSWQVSMKLDQNGGIRYPSWSTDQIYSRQQKSLRKFETWLDAFYRTICSSVIPNRPSQQADNATGTSRAKFETRYMFNAWLTHAQNEQGIDIGTRFEEFDTPLDRWHNVHLATLWSHISASTLSRRMFRMSEQKFNEEWLGLAPEDARIGDSVVILEGGDVPYILRRREQTADGLIETWELIGDAYVEGIMDGEATKTGDEMGDIWIF